MKIKVKFEELVNTLGFASTILSDKSVEDRMKNIIFLVNDGEVKVVGYNAFTFSRTELNTVETEDIPGNGWQFQVRSSNLEKILSSFSKLYKTKVNDVEFEDDGVRIKATLFEESIKEEDSRLSQKCEFQLENVPILGSVMKEINMEFPENPEVVESAELFFYIESLLPLMSNDSASKNESKLNFAPDYVFVMSAQMSAYFKNKLPDAFKQLTLSYSSVNFLKKLTEGTTDVQICRIDKYLCIQSENTEAFMKYQNIKIKYQAYLDRLNTEKGIVVDRLYLKDVLHRMSSISPDGKMLITEDGDLEVTNSNFHQVIPLIKVKEGTAGISFNLPVAFFEKSIAGRDDVFSGELFIYFVPTARGYSVFMKDKTGAWLSNTTVTRA